MSEPSRPSGSLILDQPWQIEMYQLFVLKHRFRAQARGIRFKKMATVRAFNERFGLSCRTYADCEKAVEKIIRDKEIEHDIAISESKGS